MEDDKNIKKKRLAKKRVTPKKENIKEAEIEVKEIENKGIESKEIIELRERNDTSSKDGKSLFNLAEVIVIMIITALFGALIGAVVAFVGVDNNAKNNGVTISNENFTEFVNTYNDILNNYYEDIDEKSLIDSAIKGMVDFLGDPYSEYFDSEESKAFDEELEGEFVGMGAEIRINEEGTISVSKLFKNGPALAAGIKEGDIINKVGNQEVNGLSVTDVAFLIKNGAIGTKVTVGIIRNEEKLDVEITRGKVEIPTAVGSIIEKNGKKIGLITISSFAKNTAMQFAREYDDLKSQGVESLIVDLRYNFGGYLSVAKDIADLFLDKNSVVYQTDTKGKIEKALSNTDKTISIPAVIIVNAGSASASEVLAAALNENINTPVVGIKTYGKGTVQKVYKLSNGSSVKYTIQNWLTPKGNAIDAVGIEPTVLVEQSEDYYTNPVAENDKQLQKAIELLIK